MLACESQISLENKSLRCFKYFINSLLLITIPAQGLFSQNESYTIFIENSPDYEFTQIPAPKDNLFSFDDVLHLIEELEEGDLEKIYGSEELEKITYFLVALAKEGIVPNDIYEEYLLETDIEELLYEGNPYSYAFSYDCGGKYIVVPAVFHGEGEAVLCKGWVKKKWSQTKKFVKKHKKAIIIGAAVIVAATIVICVVAAASTAGAVAAGAAAAAGSDKEAKNPPSNKSNSDNSASETPILQTEIEEQIIAFKQDLVEESPEDPAFGEKVRNFGSLLAHETLDGVSELASVVPQLAEEINAIGDRLAPNSLPDSEHHKSPMENYEGLIATGHQKIDDAFSTDLAERYTPEGKANDPRNNFTVGMLPPPGLLGGPSVNIEKFSEAGKAIDRAGFTKAGRALMKHGYRPDSAFPKPVGNPAQINAHGQEILETILHHPERQVMIKQTKIHGEVVEICVPEVGGVRFNSSGEMIGFLEP